METLAKNKKLLGLVTLVVAIFFLYNFLANSGEETAPRETGLATTEADDELIKMATELSNVNFNKELFSAPGYRFLTDFSTVIPQQPVGRTNPFDIIGRD